MEFRRPFIGYGTMKCFEVYEMLSAQAHVHETAEFSNCGMFCVLGVGHCV
jgi:hypothetical protein